MSWPAAPGATSYAFSASSHPRIRRARLGNAPRAASAPPRPPDEHDDRSRVRFVSGRRVATLNPGRRSAGSTGRSPNAQQSGPLVVQRSAFVADQSPFLHVTEHWPHASVDAHVAPAVAQPWLTRS